MQAAREGSHVVDIARAAAAVPGGRSADLAPKVAVTPRNGIQASLLEANWHKSSFSGPNGDCVEAAELPAGVAVRNSRFPDGPALLFTESEWDAFVRGVKGNEFG
jgi:Domain of unknown function (DUF397)